MDQNHPDDSRGASFLSGLVLGGMVGAFFALMVAGDKDKEDNLKQALKKKTKEVMKNLPKILDDLEKKGGDLAEKVVERGGEITTGLSESEDPRIKDLQERGRLAARRFFSRSGKKV